LFFVIIQMLALFLYNERISFLSVDIFFFFKKIKPKHKKNNRSYPRHPSPHPSLSMIIISDDIGVST